MLGNGKSGEVAEGGIHIDEFDEGLGLLPGGILHIRGVQNHRDAGRDFIVRRFSPDAHVTEVPTVIAPKDDNGVVALTRFIESIQNEANLGINIRSACEIGMHKGVRKLGPHIAGFGNAVADPQLKARVETSGRAALRWILMLGGGNFFRIVEVPVFLGCDKMEVRFGETETNKEGLLRLGLKMLVESGNREKG